MAVIRNITRHRLTLFHRDAPPINPGDETTVRDERFIARAWPKTVWEVVDPPEGCVDVGPVDAYRYQPKPDPEPFTAAPAEKDDPDDAEESES